MAYCIRRRRSYHNNKNKNNKMSQQPPTNNIYPRPPENNMNATLWGDYATNLKQGMPEYNEVLNKIDSIHGTMLAMLYPTHDLWPPLPQYYTIHASIQRTYPNTKKTIFVIMVDHSHIL
jgi:hypothetical protein